MADQSGFIATSRLASVKQWSDNGLLTNYIENYSLTQYLTATLAILLALYFVKILRNYWIQWENMKTLAKQFDGPPVTSILGQAWPFLKDLDNNFKLFFEMSKECSSTFRAWLGPQLVIVVSGPKDLEIILNSPKAAKKAFVYKFMEPLCVNALINGNGSSYRKHKKHIIPYINGKNVLHHYISTFNRHSQICLQHLEQKVNTGEFDMHEAMEACFADMIFETVLGISGTAQIDGDLNLPRAMERILDLFFKRIVSPWLYPQIMLEFSSTGRKMKELQDIIIPFFDKIISDKRKIYEALKVNKEASDNKAQVSVLDFVIKEAIKTGAWTHEEIRSDIIATFFGSNDTLLTTISFTILMLAMHPEIQEKVRAEVQSVIGDEEIIEESLQQLKYTEMALKETLRLYPAGPVTAREITDDLEIAHHTLPKGTTVMLLICVTHRSEKYWVAPEKYNPDRFTPENSQGRHPYAFVPFSGGYRSCPGYRFGLKCLKVVLVHLLRNFEFRTTMKMEDLKLKANISVRSRSGYPVSMYRLN